MIKAEILVPLLNANEPEARLVGIHAKDRQAVEKGALLFTLETTKAAADVESPAAGFVRMLARQGDTLAVGDLIAFITESADEPVQDMAATTDSGGRLRITRPARRLVEQLGLNLATLPVDKLVTEAMVREIAGQAAAPLEKLILPRGEGQPIVIYGAGGHAKAVIELVIAIGTFHIVGLVDDNISAGTEVLGRAVLGTRAILPALAAQGVHLAANGVGGIIDINIRVRLFELLESSGFSLPGLTHPRATVEPSAALADGVQVFANAYVGSSARLHPRCMINTNAVVSHDCEIGSYTHIAPGALLAGEVHVGQRTLVGMGVTTAIGIRIGDNVRIGNGAIIYADVPDRTLVPAGKVWAVQSQ